MKIYLVGGAVRDQILNLPVKEKDWVVVGATVNELLTLGFRPVGKDFPVFLHPETGEEYALARTERKVKQGYTGFDFDTSPHVTLEEDLKRRDLTINAMALTPEGVLIDPYQGKQDLENKLLHHVSDSFIEDPVRILRVARFAARYFELGFTVAPDTIALMRQMVSSGEINALVAERVWKELERALSETHPEQFFQVLTDSNALPILFPELQMNSLGMHALLKATKISSDTPVRFAALLHHLKQDSIKALCERYRIPAEYRDLALLVSRHLSAYQNASHLSPADLLNLLQSVDAFRREDRFIKFLTACEAASKQSNADWLRDCYAAAKSVNVRELVKAGFSNLALAEKIKEMREKAIEKLQS